MMMFKVCKRCLQPCSLRQKKLCSYDKYFKIYSKKLTPPLTPFRGGGQQLQRNFNFILRDLAKKNAQNQRAKLIFWKWVKLLLYNFGLFQQVFENLKLNKLVKEERRLDLEDRIWRLKFGTNAVLKLHFEEWIWKLVLFERLAFNSLGFGRGAQVGKTSLLEVEFIFTAQASTLGVFNFFIWHASGPGIPPKPSIFRRRRRIFLQCEAKIVRRHTS